MNKVQLNLSQDGRQGSLLINGIDLLPFVSEVDVMASIDDETVVVLRIPAQIEAEFRARVLVGDMELIQIKNALQR